MMPRRTTRTSSADRRGIASATWVIAALVIAVNAHSVRGQTLYKYVDEQGHVTFTTSPTKPQSELHVLQGATTQVRGAPPVEESAPDPGEPGTTTFERDPGGRVTKGVSPESTANYDYDANGHVTHGDTPERTVDHEYDAVGNVTHIETPEKNVDYEDNADRELIDAAEVPR